MFTTFLLVCFVSLKERTLETRKNVFLFYFESFFRSWDNQILTFQIFKCHDVIKCLSMNQETFYWITWEVNRVWEWNLASVCDNTKKTIKKFYEKCDLETSPGLFIFSVKRNRRRSAYWFGQILILLLFHIQYKWLASKISFSNGDCA